MADQYILCLIGAMDHLWFNHIVLFSSEPTSLLLAKTLKPPQFTTSSESLTGLSSSSSLSPPSDEEEEEKTSSDSSPVTPLGVSNNEERPTRLNLITGRARSHSSSPSTQKRRQRSLRHSESMLTLQKSMSFRSLCELELEEVQGFMDLGFIFKKEHLDQRMMSVVPGLQRVGLYKNKKKPELDFEASRHHEISKDDETDHEQEEYEKGIMRPYLSEAWLIKRPGSPLLKLRMPRVSASADMKKHLRFWAKTVASEINLER
ncbi:hypothetical protein ACOSP7_029632 [Xanthoceras sorbifolium]